MFETGIKPEIPPEQETAMEVDETPVITDAGDVIHSSHLHDGLPDFDPAVAIQQLYHADDEALVHLPKARQPPSAKMLAIVAAIGGTTVALLGVGGYALNRARQQRKVMLADQGIVDVRAVEVPAEAPPAPQRQYAFTWPAETVSGDDA